MSDKFPQLGHPSKYRIASGTNTPLAEYPDHEVATSLIGRFKAAQEDFTTNGANATTTKSEWQALCIAVGQYMASSDPVAFCNVAQANLTTNTNSAADDVAFALGALTV